MRDGLPEDSCRFFHRVGPVSDEDPVFAAFGAVFENDLLVLLCHLQTIDHHQGSDFHRNLASAQIQHFADVPGVPGLRGSPPARGPLAAPPRRGAPGLRG